MNNLEKAVSLHRKWPSVDAHLDLASEVFYRRKDGMCQVAENVYLENWHKSGFKLIVSSLFADSDYPSTFLRQTLEQISAIKNEEMNTSIIFITHDLGVVADICQRVIVMYGGLIMEEGTVDEIFYKPRHPYTMGLLSSIPEVSSGEKTRLIPIKGTPPDLLNPPAGCPFFDRCEYAMEICRNFQPPYFEEDNNHRTMCWLMHPDAPENAEYEKQKGGVRVEK